MLFALLALLCLVGAIGLFCWLVLERTKYYETGESKHKFIQMTLAMACVGLLLLGVGLYTIDERD